MNTFIAALAGLCASRPLEEKRLVAPTRRIGNQWLDAVARAGQPLLNVRVETLRSLAAELADPLLASAGLAVAPRRAEQLLVDRVLRTLLRDDRLPYLSRARTGGGLAATVLTSLSEVRLAGVPAGRLRRGVLEDAEKGADLKLLLGEYDRLLAAEKLADYATVLRLAIERLTADPDALGRDTRVLMPQDAEPNGMELRLLAALPAQSLQRLAVDPPGIPERVDFSCAVGVGNEVRSALRGCLESGLPLDEVEVLYTESAYTQVLVETFAAVDRPGFNPTDEAPVTFAQGLPCALSRPGRGLNGWLRWIGEGYPQGALVTMIREGLLETGQVGEGKIGFSRLAAQLRTIPIGQERGRYLPKIDEQIASARARQAPGLETLVVIRDLVERLVDLSPPANADGAALVAAAVKFLATCARSAGRFDSFAAEKLRAELDETTNWLGRSGGVNAADVRDWLLALPAETRIGGSGPRPGWLHADHVRSGGHSGRPHTIVVGLDDGRFPGASLQDPLLLDGERSRLDPALPTAGRRLEQTIESFGRLLGRLRGTVTLCWPSRDVVQDSECFPSQVVLDAFRRARGAPQADHAELLLAAGTPASFAPERPTLALDPGEWWLWRFTGGTVVANAGEILARRAPHLAAGLAAAAWRSSAAFTAWDGRVPLAGADLDPAAPTGKVLSSNGLETTGACPRRFFYRYALDIAPPEELVVDPERWLDPLLTGSLLHELFEEYVREIVGTGWPADYKRGRVLIRALLEKKLVQFLAAHPIPSPAAYTSEREQLELAAETLVREEERHALATGSEPVYVEASLGMPPGEHGTALDHPEPIPVFLPGGETIRVRGRVDRIDRDAGGWTIWDYKTGGTWGYDRTDPFPEGRKIQPYLYFRMVERRLRETVDPNAAVRWFGYFFPGSKGRGERIGWDAGRLAAGADVLARLCRIIAAGAFVATTDAEKDCRLCDYRTACGDVVLQAAASARKVQSGEPLLAPLAQLRAKSLGKAAGRREDVE